ncbi:MAG TPA: hypothetical protein VK545_10200 [Streptomyces sp.]|nr:hypothetical protein [Streptomyces sp.]
MPSAAQQKWNHGKVGEAAPGRRVDRPGECPDPRCGQQATGRAPAGLTTVSVPGSRQPATVYCPAHVEYGRALAEVRALPPSTSREIIHHIQRVLTSLHPRSHVCWEIAYNPNEQAAAVLYTSTNTPLAVRRRHLEKWASTLTAAGYTVEVLPGGPFAGDGDQSPWWLRVTGKGGAR